MFFISNPKKQSHVSRQFQGGQSMTEYLVITALIAVASISLFSFFGTALRTQIAGMANEISGTSATANITSAKSAATAATANAKTDRNMGTYDQGGTKSAASSH